MDIETLKRQQRIAVMSAAKAWRTFNYRTHKTDLCREKALAEYKFLRKIEQELTTLLYGPPDCAQLELF